MILAEYTITVSAPWSAEADEVLDRLDELEPEVSLDAVVTRLREGLGDLSGHVKIEVSS
jgi:hypothetical protein